MPEFPIPSARILLVSQIQGGQLPSLPPCPVRLWFVSYPNVYFSLHTMKNKRSRFMVRKEKYTIRYNTDTEYI